MCLCDSRKPLLMKKMVHVNGGASLRIAMKRTSAIRMTQRPKKMKHPRVMRRLKMTKARPISR